MSSSFRKRRARRGISLMEVLISMFVLTVGLLGVAALIPAGRHEIVEAAKLDNASMVGRAAFRDMQVRGFLNPAGWNYYSGGSYYPVYDANRPDPFQGQLPTSNSYGTGIGFVNNIAYAIDPLAITGASNLGPYFPYYYSNSNGDLSSKVNLAPEPTPLRPAPMLRIVPFTFGAGVNLPQQNAVFDSVFRSSFDQILEPNATNSDFPPSPKWFPGNTRRMNDGNYTWLATVVSDGSKQAQFGNVTVSVAVFYKRVVQLTTDNPPKAIGEYVVELDPFPVLPMPGGGEAILRDLPNHPLTNKPVSVRPGQWLMLGGRRTLSTVPSVVSTYEYRWYRVLSAATPVTSGGATSQRVTLSGTDWNVPHTSTRAWIFDNIVNVYEKQMPLEVQ